MLMRGIRGATSVENDDPSEIHLVTKDLLTSMTVANNICTEDIASIIFTVTTDIKSCFPAAAARDLGWTEVPLLSATEATVVGFSFFFKCRFDNACPGSTNSFCIS